MEQHVLHLGLLLVCLLDRVKQLGADDAAVLPDAGYLGEVGAEVVLLGCRLDQVQPLCVGGDHRKMQRAVQGGNEALPVLLGSGIRAMEHARRLYAGLLEPGQDTGVDRLREGRNRHAEVQGCLRRPLSRPLLACGVENLLDQRVAGLVVALGQALRRDVDQEAANLRRCRPLLEDCLDLAGRHARGATQDVVDLADQLHDPVFDAVVDHLHVVARRMTAAVGHARPVVVGLRGDLLEYRGDALVGLEVAAGHDRRPPQGTLLAAGDAAAYEVQASLLQALGAPVGIGEMGVSAIDEHIAWLEMLKESVDHPIRARSCSDHQ